MFVLNLCPAKARCGSHKNLFPLNFRRSPRARLFVFRVGHVGLCSRLPEHAAFQQVVSSSSSWACVVVLRLFSKVILYLQLNAFALNAVVTFCFCCPFVGRVRSSSKSSSSRCLLSAAYLAGWRPSLRWSPAQGSGNDDCFLFAHAFKAGFAFLSHAATQWRREQVLYSSRPALS